jgi:hypothetical protein
MCQEMSPKSQAAETPGPAEQIKVLSIRVPWRLLPLEDNKQGGVPTWWVRMV